MEAYDQLKTVGRGAFAVVKLVRRKSDGVMFACKTIQCPMSDLSAKERTEITQEVKLLAILRHPNVIGFHDNFVGSVSGAAGARCGSKFRTV